MGLREFRFRVEGFFLDGSGQDVLMLRSDERGSLAGLDVLEVQNDMRIALAS